MYTLAPGTPDRMAGRVAKITQMAPTARPRRPGREKVRPVAFIYGQGAWPVPSPAASARP